MLVSSPISQLTHLPEPQHAGNWKLNSSVPQLYLYAVLIVLYVCYLYIFICGNICQEKLTRLELVGYRCVTDSEVYMNITSVPHNICIYECMTRKDCSFFNYNIEQNTCHLSNHACGVLAADQAFQVNYLGNVYRSKCLQLLPTETSNSIQTVSNPSCYYGYPTCYVDRLVSTPNILPGKYVRELNKVISVFNGDSFKAGTMEILDVRTGCQVTWMPFSAGDAVPVGAVEGGFLASNGATLYVIRAPIENFIVIGYYDPIDCFGYVSSNGMKTVINMELLVLL